jgi:hypothetical protein
MRASVLAPAILALTAALPLVPSVAAAGPALAGTAPADTAPAAAQSETAPARPALAASAPAGRSMGARTDSLAGVRSISTARGSITPECLSVDSKGQATVAALCFREGNDHSWKINSSVLFPNTYFLRRGEDCLTLDLSQGGKLLKSPCNSDYRGQQWRITARQAGEYQLEQAKLCVTAKTGEALMAPCVTAKDTFGNDGSGQAWKILKDPQSVIPDPGFGKGGGGE